METKTRTVGNYRQTVFAILTERAQVSVMWKGSDEVFVYERKRLQGRPPVWEDFADPGREIMPDIARKLEGLYEHKALCGFKTEEGE